MNTNKTDDNSVIGYTYIKFYENMTKDDLMRQLKAFNITDKMLDEWRVDFNVLNDDLWKVRYLKCMGVTITLYLLLIEIVNFNSKHSTRIKM